MIFFLCICYRGKWACNPLGTNYCFLFLLLATDITSGAMETGMSERKDNTMEGPSQLQEMFKTIKLSQQMKQDFSQQLKQEGGSLGDERVGDPPPDVTIHPPNR